MPRAACATIATATTFSPCKAPEAIGLVNEAAVRTKTKSTSAEGSVKAVNAPSAPNQSAFPVRPVWRGLGQPLIYLSFRHCPINCAQCHPYPQAQSGIGSDIGQDHSDHLFDLVYRHT